MTLSVFLNTSLGLLGSDEHELGLRDLRNALGRGANLHPWHEFDASMPECAPGKLLPTVQG